MAPLPLAKLASLFIKTLAKPAAKKIKLECSRFQPTQDLLVGIGQTTHIITSRMTIWSEGYTVRMIKPLQRETAMTRGAELVGEGFIFLVAGGLVVWEYNKKADEDNKKKVVAKEKIENLDARIEALEQRININIELPVEDSLKPSMDLPMDPPQDYSKSERRWWPF